MEVSQAHCEKVTGCVSFILHLPGSVKSKTSLMIQSVVFYLMYMFLWSKAQKIIKHLFFTHVAAALKLPAQPLVLHWDLCFWAARHGWILFPAKTSWCYLRSFWSWQERFVVVPQCQAEEEKDCLEAVFFQGVAAEWIKCSTLCLDSALQFKNRCILEHSFDSLLQLCAFWMDNRGLLLLFFLSGYIKHDCGRHRLLPMYACVCVQLS